MYPTLGSISRPRKPGAGKAVAAGLGWFQTCPWVSDNQTVVQGEKAFGVRGSGRWASHELSRGFNSVSGPWFQVLSSSVGCRDAESLHFWGS